MRIFIFILYVSIQQMVGWASDSDSLKRLTPQKEHAQETLLITQFLTGYHYKKVELNDSISSIIFDILFKNIDPNKAYFLEKDIRKFEKYRYQLDDALKVGDLQFGYEVFNAYRKNAIACIDVVMAQLDREFDFGKEEYFDIDRSQFPWPKSSQEQKEVWRKIIKNQALTYKLVGKEWDEISTLLKERYQRVVRSIYQYTSEDAFQLYMNAFGDAFDPHTSYFSPLAAEDFNIDMSLSLEGIGAQLTQKMDYTVVADIIPGGPAFKTKILKQEDKIIGVAQGDEGEFEDVIGWRLRDVVKKIRGPKGTVVRLLILKSDSKKDLPDTLRLVRDKIKLETQEAKSEIIPIAFNGKTYKMGVITLPSFYINFEEKYSGNKDYKSTTRDVKKLIASLKEEGIDGLLIDLRYNVGGSLDEAVELTGLFIPKGPVVQIKDMRGKVDKLEDKDNGQVWYEGPVSVLVNRYSASASEIFSAAIQDYQRGIIVGENSFGKGTVQNLLNLNPQLERQISNMKNTYKRLGLDKKVEELNELETYIHSQKITLGQLKLTIGKFYRITGKSTQKIGVEPDIQFPTGFNPMDVGESSRANALPWDEISSTQFESTKWINQNVVDELNQSYRKHLNEDEDLIQLVKKLDVIKKEQNQSQISLNLSQRKKKNEEINVMNTSLDSENREEEEENSRLSEDVYLKEGLLLLAELTSKTFG